MLYYDNPFKVLGVSPTDDRREIVRKAEEKALLQDTEKCLDARTTLTNPQRRISAEIHWFLDCCREEAAIIEQYITDVLSDRISDELPWERYTPLTQLNIQLACLDAQQFDDLSLTRFYILGVSRLYESVNPEKVLLLINENRKKAGFPEVPKRQDVNAALNEMRVEIRQALSQKLQRLPQDSYTQAVTMLSESYSGNQRYKGHAVLEDIISEYRLYINEALTTQGNAVAEAAERVAQEAQKADVSSTVQNLISSLYAWDKLAQPLQLAAQIKGDSHDESREMFRTLRGLALKLHNDYGMSAEALAITKAAQEVFNDLPEYSALLSDDIDALAQFIEQKKADDALSPFLTEVNEAYDGLKTCPETQRQNRLNALVSAVKQADQMIRAQYIEKSTSDSLRSLLGLLVCSFAVDLHNDYQRTSEGLSLITLIEPVFADLSETQEKITETGKALSAQKLEQDAAARVIRGLKELEALAEAVKNASATDRNEKINALISNLAELDKTVKDYFGTTETINQIRTRIAYIARSAGIDLHNTKNDSYGALRVITAAKKEFSDMPDIVDVLNEDTAALNTQIQKKKAAEEKAWQEEKDRKTKWILRALLVAVLLISVASNACNTGSPSKSTSYSAATTTKQTAAPQAMPTNGRVFYCSSTYRPSSFKVTNSGSSNYYMKFVKAGTDTSVITFFVRAHSIVTIDMPEGNLELHYAYGNSWYGEAMLFGEDTRYAKDEEYYDFSNYTWEISLQSSSNSGTSMNLEYIDANEF